MPRFSVSANADRRGRAPPLAWRHGKPFPHQSGETPTHGAQRQTPRRTKPHGRAEKQKNSRSNKKITRLRRKTFAKGKKRVGWVYGQIGGVATNVNQIARAANRTHDPDYPAFMAERAALGREFARVEGLVQRLLELGARRADGLARLEAAAALVGPVRRAPRSRTAKTGAS